MSVKSLDELQWSDPAAAEEMQGIHSNSVLFYFMRSPYFDKTSNNNTVYNQALHNASMFPILATRDRFEDFLRSMSGVEYIVHQAPAEMAPGTGTGVWVIRKQLRRKRNDGQPDDLTVYADYFVVGYNVYQAPTLADVLSARITSMAVALSKAFPAMDSMQLWSPARGHVYEMGTGAADGEEEEDDDDDDDDDDDEEDEKDSAADDVSAMVVDGGETQAQATRARAPRSPAGDIDDSSSSDDDDINPRLAEESYAIHMLYGGEYMDEQPISGRPGEFHIAKLGAPRGRTTAVGALAGGDGSDGADAGAKDTGKSGGSGGKKSAKDGKDAGSPKTGKGAPAKPKRRKGKAVSTG